MAFNRNSPSFILFPVNNNRTAWRPVALPVIFCVPRRRTAANEEIPYSRPYDVRIYISKAPKSTRVAGHEHVTTIPPDNQVYNYPIDSAELASYYIDIAGSDIYRQIDPLDPTKVVPVELVDIKDGDIVNYTTSNGINSTFVYYSDADYFDLSSIHIDTQDLPDGHYHLVYETYYYERILTADSLAEFACIDPNKTGLANLIFTLNHPGDIMAEFYRLTPPIYLTNADKKDDTTLGFYRLFSDILQDIKDEQDLLKSVNFVYNCSPELIPYLSSQLGWELPYFPQSLSRVVEGKNQGLDKLRRAILRRTVELQTLRGSSKAIERIFNLFGYKVLIDHLWWSRDGKILIKPNEKLPDEYAGQEITYNSNTYTTDTVESAHEPSGFYSNVVDLLYRPQFIDGIDGFETYVDGGPITITAIICDIETAEELKAIDTTETAVIINGQVSTTSLDNTSLHHIPKNIVNHLFNKYGTGPGYSLSVFRVLNTSSLNVGETGEDVPAPVNIGTLPSSISYGENPVAMITRDASFNRDVNKLTYCLNGNFTDKKRRIFIYATYSRAEAIIPEGLKPSNYFSIQVLSRTSQDTIDGIALDFALGFLEKLKAFHSLLYLINTRIVADEVYQVTDLGVGGPITQRCNTDIGQLQVPPVSAIDQDKLDQCSLNPCNSADPKDLGYKDADLEYRKRIIDNLVAEWTAWTTPAPAPIAALTNNLELKRARFHRLSAISPGALTGIRPPSGQAAHTDKTKIWLYNVGPSTITLRNAIASDQANQFLTSTGADVALEVGQLAFLTYDANVKKWRIDTDIDQSIYSLVSIDKTPCEHNYMGQDRITTDGYNLINTLVQPSRHIADTNLINTDIVADEDSSEPVQRFCEIDYKTDYMYKGRVESAIAFEKWIDLSEDFFLNSGCGITMGAGAYYMYPAVSREFRSGVSESESFSGKTIYTGLNNGVGIEGYRTDITGNLITKSYTTSSDNILGKLYREYAKPSEYSLHYTNSSTANVEYQRNNLALHKPSLGITKTTMHLPGCRFPMMNQLASDYISSWEARPWDFASCDNPCSTTFLNPYLETATDGEQTLVYDAAQYTVYGNGLTPDIPNLNDGVPVAPNNVIHKIYTSNSSGGSPAVTLDQMDDGNGMITTSEVIFYRTQLSGGSLTDYIDGYPSLRNRITYSYSNGSALSDIVPGLPAQPVRTGTYFLLSSGILAGETGFRIGCDSNEPDDVTLLSVMDLEEDLSSGIYYLDGVIPSLLEIA